MLKERRLDRQIRTRYFFPNFNKNYNGWTNVSLCTDVKIYYSPHSDFLVASCIQTDADGLVLVVSQQDTYVPEYYSSLFRVGGLAVHAIREPDTVPMLNTRWQIFLRDI